MITHLTSGDAAANLLQDGGFSDPLIVWRDICYDGPRFAGMPQTGQLEERARFLSALTQGGLSESATVESLHNQYTHLQQAAHHGDLVLWFDACLFDQSMLVHVLTCLDECDKNTVELICIAAWPGIEPYHGLGQLSSKQLISCVEQKQTLNDEHFSFARKVEHALVDQNHSILKAIADQRDAPLPWVPAAIKRLLAEIPDANGLGLLARLTLDSIRSGVDKPASILKHVAAADTPPQYWGDTTLWATINNLAIQGLVTIQGPRGHLPQWHDDVPLHTYTIKPC